MELFILDSCGLPESSILSVRSGPTRRQSILPCLTPFRLPAGPWPLRIDVLTMLGKSHHGASFLKLDADGCCKVPLEAKDGRHMSVTLQVFDGQDGGRLKVLNFSGAEKALNEPEAEAAPNEPVRRRDSEAEARTYLDRHRVHEFMHSLFELLLRERPVDPYSFIAEKFREAAEMEPQKRPDDLPALGGDEKVISRPPVAPESPKVLRSNVSTAPSPHPPLSPPEQPEGSIQVTVRTLRGRCLTRLVVRSTEKVESIKLRLEASLGVRVACQHLLWWGETLPNDTTLEDHGVPAKTCINLCWGTRDPRLKMTLSGSSDGGVRLWNLQNGELLQDFSITSGSSVVQALAVDWIMMRAVTGCHDGSMNVWDLKAGTRSETMVGHIEEVHAIEVDWPNMRAVSGSGDASARLWNLDTLGCERVLASESTVCTIVVDWAKSRAFGGLRSGLVRIWDLVTGACLRDLDGGKIAAEASNSAISCTTVDWFRCRAVSGFEDGHCSYWHFDDDDGPPSAKPETKTWLAHYSPIRTISPWWVETNSRALCGSDDGSLSLWRLDTKEIIARFSRHIGCVWALYADWTCDRALSGAFDGCIKLWDLRTGQCLRTLQAHSRPVRSVAGGCSQ